MSFISGLQSEGVTRAVSEGRTLLDPLRQYILDNFGQNGLYAAYLLGAAIALILIYKLIKLSFDLLFFVVIPSAISAYVLSMFLPYSFFYLLPAATALFTLGLLLRAVSFSKG